MRPGSPRTSARMRAFRAARSTPNSFSSERRSIFSARGSGDLRVWQYRGGHGEALQCWSLQWLALVLETRPAVQRILHPPHAPHPSPGHRPVVQLKSTSPSRSRKRDRTILSVGWAAGAGAGRTRQGLTSPGPGSGGSPGSSPATVSWAGCPDPSPALLPISTFNTQVSVGFSCSAGAGCSPVSACSRTAWIGCAPAGSSPPRSVEMGSHTADPR